MPLTRDLRQSEPVCTDSVRLPPDVDFRRLPHDSAAIGSIREACENNGYFVLKHAIDDVSVIDGALNQMQNFFSLDDEDSRKKQVMVTTKENKHGWTPMFGEPAYQPGTVAHLESFDCGRPGGLSGNVWPGLPDFQRDICRCWHTMANIGEVVLESLALAANVKPGRFRDHCQSHELSTMRLLNYPANDDPTDETNVGIAAHTDFECITLILQTAPGLELRDPAGNWMDAPPDSGKIVVLLGDMLENWSNGHYQATGHRVRNSSSQRFSIVMFFAVNDDQEIEPMAEFVSADKPANYPTTSQRSHLDREVRQAERHRDERDQETISVRSDAESGQDPRETSNGPAP